MSTTITLTEAQSDQAVLAETTTDNTMTPALPKDSGVAVDPAKEAIARGHAHADPDWRKAAMTIIKRLASRKRNFISRDVLERLERLHFKTPDLRAIGGVLMEAKKLGIIESDGYVRRNDRYTRACTNLWRGCRAKSTEAEPQK